jgi:hypothetical protein
LPSFEVQVIGTQVGGGGLFPLWPASASKFQSQGTGDTLRNVLLNPENFFDFTVVSLCPLRAAHAAFKNVGCSKPLANGNSRRVLVPE